MSENDSQVTLYDTTLRDGSQGEGIHFSLSDKLRIAERLDEFGMHYIEGGWPGSNVKDEEFFKQVGKLNLKHAKVAAFGSTRKKDSKAKVDTQVAMLLAAETPVITLVCKTSVLHVTRILETDLEENLAMIRDTISFLREHGREVIFDGEHFFDGYKLDALYATSCCQAAVEAGASYLVLCDTNGGTLPDEIREITKTLSGLVGPGRKPVRLGIHTHDDSGLAVANALAAVDAGTLQVQGTVNGFGERTGNCNLVTVAANLQLKMKRQVVRPEQLAQLRDLSIFVDEVANQLPNPRAPFVGSTAFAHKGGIHVNAVNKLPESYEHIPPHSVGNARRVLVGELAGRINVVLKARQLGFDLDDKSPAAVKVLEQIKRLEAQGYEFEAADASFEMLLKKALGQFESRFELVEYDVTIRKHGVHHVDDCHSRLKLRVGDHEEHQVADGDGPVNALDGAMRKALIPHFPALKALRLVDYKVRIVDSGAGTAARTRVLIESSDGDVNWTTVGVSGDIIEASWFALLDSVEYFLSKRS